MGNCLAVFLKHPNAGHGGALMRHVEAELEQQGCPKLNLQVRATNQAVPAVYRQIGYSMDEVVDLGKRFIRSESEN